LTTIIYLSGTTVDSSLLFILYGMVITWKPIQQINKDLTIEPTIPLSLQIRKITPAMT
jgi:hypothetical protein